MIQISPEIIQSLIKQSQETIWQLPQGVSLNAHLQSLLIESNPQMSVIEAENVINNISEGIKDFKEKYRSIKTNDEIVDLVQFLDGRTVEEKFNALINLIAVLRLSSLPFAELTEEKINEVRQQVTANLVPSDEAIDFLSNQLHGAFAQIQIKNIGFDAIKRIFESGVISPEDFIDFCSDEDNALVIATIAYIGRQNESQEFSVIPEDPRQLGISIAAGLEQASNDAKLADGKISYSQWEVATKNIMGVLLFLTLLIADGLFSIGIATGIMALALGIIGFNAIAYVIGFAAAFLVIDYMSEKGVDLLFNLMDRASQIYDIFVLWLRGKLKKKNHNVQEGADEIKVSDPKQTPVGQPTNEVEPDPIPSTKPITA